MKHHPIISASQSAPAHLSPETAERMKEIFRKWEKGDPQTVARIEAILRWPHPEIDSMQRAIEDSERITAKDLQLRMTH